MRFRDVPLTPAYDVRRLVSEHGLWEFGLRHRSGHLHVCANRVGEPEYELDYCGGFQPREAGMLFEVVKIILEDQPEGLLRGDLGTLLPHTRARGMLLDPQSHDELLRLAHRATRRRMGKTP